MFKSKHYLKLYHMIDEVQSINEDFVHRDYSYCGYTIIVTRSRTSEGIVLNIHVYYQSDIVLNNAIKLRSKWVNPEPLVRLIINLCY